MLNKTDLIAFGDVRGTNEKKAVYEIEFSEESTTTGTIKGRRSRREILHCGRSSRAVCLRHRRGVLLHGIRQALRLPARFVRPLLRGSLRDYKFAEGLLAVMGEAMIGGNVVTENGFIRVKKA